MINEQRHESDEQTKNDRPDSLTDQVKHRLSDAKETTIRETKEKAREGMHAAERRLDSLADSFHDASGALRRDQEGLAAQVTEAIAERVSGMSAYFRQREPADVVEDVADYARRHPEVLVTAGVAAGLVAGRFLRSSSQRRDAERQARSIAAATHSVQPRAG